jgi:hypothetical protein
MFDPGAQGLARSISNARHGGLRPSASLTQLGLQNPE